MIVVILWYKKEIEDVFVFTDRDEALNVWTAFVQDKRHATIVKASEPPVMEFQPSLFDLMEPSS